MGKGGQGPRKVHSQGSTHENRGQTDQRLHMNVHSSASLSGQKADAGHRTGNQSARRHTGPFNYAVFRGRSDTEAWGHSPKVSRGQGQAGPFKAVNPLCDLWQWVQVITCSSKPLGCTPPRVNPQADYGLQVTMMHRGQFVDCTSVPPGGSVGSWEGCVCEGRGVNGNSVLSSQSCCQPNTALKIKVVGFSLGV